MEFTVSFLVIMSCYGLQLAASQTCYDVCSPTSWEPWEACSSSCGTGTRTRTRDLCCPKDVAHSLALCMRHCGISDDIFEDTGSCYACMNGMKDGLTSCSCTGGYTGSCCQEEISCSKPSAPSHGTVTQKDVNAIYDCNPDYDLKGDGTRTCQTNGVWNGTEPTCIPKPCSEPTDPLHGSVSVNGDVATYSCDSGYTLQGSSLRTCSLGSWSGDRVSCVHCGTLLDPPHGSVNISGSVATYSCDSGYSLDRSSERSCSDGEWSGRQPHCDATDCNFVCEYPWAVALIVIVGLAIIVGMIGALVHFLNKSSSRTDPQQDYDVEFTQNGAHPTAYPAA